MKYGSALIIDDEADIVEGLSEALSEMFDNVSKAQNGEEALDLVSNKDFDLIISDIMMPRLKGDDFLRKLRMKGVHTPIIFITGNGNKENLLSAIRLGAVEFIEKPFDIDYFISVVSRTMDFVKEKRELEKLQASKEGAAADKTIVESQKKAVGIIQVANYIKSRAQ
ncbi:MAG: response regulator [Bdellovibrionaceae bacterium]|nr:response regulator [Pseudobdellovibrionaceae bacterium]NUM58057.1 response regulator [Pseudobdellovibrionaceae bacterium]